MAQEIFMPCLERSPDIGSSRAARVLIGAAVVLALATWKQAVNPMRITYLKSKNFMRFLASWLVALVAFVCLRSHAIDARAHAARAQDCQWDTAQNPDDDRCSARCFKSTEDAVLLRLRNAKEQRLFVERFCQHVDQSISIGNPKDWVATARATAI